MALRVHIGPKGGKYVYEGGKKRYLSKTRVSDIERKHAAPETKREMLLSAAPTTKRKVSLEAVSESPKKKREPSLGDLPSDIVYLVGEMLGGDVMNDRLSATLDQIELSARIKQFCENCGKSCAEILGSSSSNDRPALLCRPLCERRYRAVRAPIMEYLTHLPRNIDSIELIMSSPAWPNESITKLTINVIKDATKRRYSCWLTFHMPVSHVGLAGIVRLSRGMPEYQLLANRVAEWRATTIHKMWVAFAIAHHTRPASMVDEDFEVIPGATSRDTGAHAISHVEEKVSPILNVTAAANLVSDFLWLAGSSGTVSLHVMPSTLREQTVAMTFQVNPTIGAV
jgi:hypothetical protein